MTPDMAQPSRNISLNEKEELRVEIKDRRGEPFVDLRVWTAPKANEPKWPTGKGILIPASRWTALQRLLADLEPEIKTADVHE